MSFSYEHYLSCQYQPLRYAKGAQTLLTARGLRSRIRLSRRFRTVARDSQLWKSAYYNRFVRPRAARIPGIRDQEVPAASLLFSSRISKWLEDEHLVRQGRQTNWKRQYKLRHNWSRGSCAVSELEIAQHPSVPGMLVRLHEDVAVTVDTTHGIRAWNIKDDQRLLATLQLNVEQDPDYIRTPTSLALDDSRKITSGLRISIGFLDGAFGTYMLQKEDQTIYCQHIHSCSINGMISAIAYASPYLLTMTDAQLLSLYCFSSESTNSSILDPPRLLSSLKSHTTWPPLSLAIRVTSVSIIASVVYSLPTYLSGWSVGLQELRLTSDGSIVQSRLASATDQGFTPLNLTTLRSSSIGPINETSPGIRSEAEMNFPSTKPTSLSYSHPYLLASHTDNTLTLYLVSSNEEHLIIGPGSRLWGHTSSVSGAHVGGRGKAVSVSLRGDEIRVWELEGGVSSRSSKQRTGGQSSVQVRPEYKASQDERTMSHPGTRSHIAQQEIANLNVNDLAVTKGWVGFDEEKVVVLREKSQGSQALVMYDFS